MFLAKETCFSMPSTNFGNCPCVFSFSVWSLSRYRCPHWKTAHSFVGHGECWCQAVGFAMGAQQLDALGASQTWIDLRLQWVELKWRRAVHTELVLNWYTGDHWRWCRHEASWLQNVTNGLSFFEAATVGALYAFAVFLHIMIMYDIPVVPHKAVAEVSKIRNL